MIVSISVFSFFSSSSFPANASVPLLCYCFSSGSQHHPEPAESATKREQWEPAGEMPFQLLYWNIKFLPAFSIKKGKEQELVLMFVSWTQIPLSSIIKCAASLIHSTLQHFDRTLVVEVFVSKLSNNITFSYNIICMNVNCILPMHQNFEANKPSLSSVL